MLIDTGTDGTGSAVNGDDRPPGDDRPRHDGPRGEQPAAGSEQPAFGGEEPTSHERTAETVPGDDPLVDTAVRRLSADVSPERPFGRPGRPLNTRSPFRIALTAALGVAVAYFLVQAIISAWSVLLLIIIAGFIAVGLNPVVERLERVGLRRGVAVGAVFVALLGFFAGVGLLIVPPLADQITDLIDQLPQWLEEARKNSTISQLNEEYGIVDQAQEYLTRPDLGAQAIGGVVGAGKLVFSVFFSVVTVLILTLYFLSSFPHIKTFAYRLVPRTRRARVGLFTDEILGRVGGYVVGALTIAVIAGVSSLVFMLIADIPFALALALLVAVTDLIPLVGATIGAVVVSVVAFFVSVPVGIASAVWFLLYQQFENYVIYPRVMKRTVDVSPAATIVAVLIGGALLGIPGALLAIPTTAAVQLIVSEIVVPRQDTS